MGNHLAWLWRNVVSPLPPSLTSIPFAISSRSVEERVAPLLLLRARAAGLVESLAPSEAALLERFYSHTLRHTLRLLEAAEELSSALSSRRIDSILLKGGAYVLTIYHHPGARPMQDVDILVRPESFREATIIARDLGYVAGLATRTGTEFLDSVALRKGDVSIDLHERLTHRLVRDPDLRPLFDRAVVSHERGAGEGAFRVLAPEDAAVHAILHIVHHGFTMRLIAFADLARLFTAPGFRWALFCSEIERVRLSGAAHVVIGVLSRNTGMPLLSRVPNRWRSGLAARAVSRLVNRETGRIRVRLSERWRYALVVRPLLDGPRHAARALLKAAISRLKMDRKRD